MQKPIVKQKTFINNSKKNPLVIQEYTQKNIHRLISHTPVTKHLAMFEEHKELNKHFAPAHLGVQISDMSKHVMNVPMCLAEDMNIKIWYQDTDSMIMDHDGVQPLADAFRKRYGRELLGKDLGQWRF